MTPNKLPQNDADTAEFIAWLQNLNPDLPSYPYPRAAAVTRTISCNPIQDSAERMLAFNSRVQELQSALEQDGMPPGEIAAQFAIQTVITLMQAEQNRSR